jgi:biotin synthase
VSAMSTSDLQRCGAHRRSWAAGQGAAMGRSEVLRYLTCPRADELLQRADAVRRQEHGDGVLVRGLLEFSNYCAAGCLYCGLRCGNQRLARYRMDADAIVAHAIGASREGYGTIVLQSGEDPELQPEAMQRVVTEVRSRCDIAITLSLGEMGSHAFGLWRSAGADRYLLKFETSNARLYQQLRPGHLLKDRIACLHNLRALGYQVGSGNMVGLPGQSLGDLADDLMLMAQLQLDMVGIGPFIPHPDTPLGGSQSVVSPQRTEQTSARSVDLVDLTLRCVAIARLLLPKAHLPATTALGTFALGGRERALQAGANVWMQDITPHPFKRLYEIYPERICRDESDETCRSCTRARVRTVGRFIQPGRGDAYRNDASSQSDLTCSESRR